MQNTAFNKLEILKSDGKKYYVMSIRKKWYALALEDFQVTFLQQHITPQAFNLKVDSNKLKTATKPITVYDFTELDEDALIHMFFKREKPWEPKQSRHDVPNHVHDLRNPDNIDRKKVEDPTGPYYKG